MHEEGTGARRETAMASPLQDQCDNGWGTTIVPGVGRRDYLAGKLDDKTARADFKLAVASTLGGKFEVSRVVVNGSAANLSAVFDATGGDTSCCAIACGSYVAGDQGILQSWSTAGFSVNGGPCSIVSPVAINNAFTRRNTVALPYHIPGVLDESEQQDYEDQCLQSLHVRFCVARLAGRPFKALLMELVLASNGGTLSRTALLRIGQLAGHHGVSIIVDEIMTGGRTGNMLLTLSQPAEFVDAVTHVTMGKWMEVGLVLSVRSYISNVQSFLSQMSTRGASTFAQCKTAHVIWNRVTGLLEQAPTRRQAVLKKLKLREADCWGMGALIFAPVSREGVFTGTKYRFLPMLSPELTIGPLRHRKADRWSRESVNLHMTSVVKKWMGHDFASMYDCSPSAREFQEAVEIFSTTVPPEIGYRFDDLRCQLRCYQHTSGDSIPVRTERVPNQHETKYVFGRLRKVGFMNLRTSTGKRTNRWSLELSMLVPWYQQNTSLKRKKQDIPEPKAGTKEGKRVRNMIV